MKRIDYSIRLAIGEVTPELSVLNELLAIIKWATELYIENMRLGETNETINTYNPTMIKLCNWNVRGLNILGKLSILENTIKNIAVTGISETHWKTTGHFTATYGNLVISSSNEKDSINGIEVIINKDIKNTVLGNNTFNNRIMSVKLEATPV